MSNNDNSLIERLTTIIGRPPVSMNIPGNQLNRLRKDKSQYDMYIRDLNQYLRELEDSVKYIDPAIQTTFDKLREELIKIIYRLVKNLTAAEKIVNSVITKPDQLKNINNNEIISTLLSKVVKYFEFEEKISYIIQQIEKIEKSKQYLNDINILREEKARVKREAEVPELIITGARETYNNDGDNTDNDNNNDNDNNVFNPKPKKYRPPKNISGSIPKILRIPRNITPINENEVVLELSTPPQKGGNTYPPVVPGTYANNNENNMESAPSSYMSAPKTARLIMPIPPNERRNLPPTFVPNVVKRMKEYLIQESRNKNTNRDRLAKLELIESPLQLLNHLKIYANILQQQYRQLNDNLRQNQIKLLDILNNFIPKLKKLYYIKDNISSKIDEVKEYIETLGESFTPKNLYINKNKPKVPPSIKLPSNFNKTLKVRGYASTKTRRNENINTRPWWRKLFTRKQSIPPQVVVEPQSIPNSLPNRWSRRPLYLLPPIEEKKMVTWKNQTGRTEHEPLSSTIEYPTNQPSDKLLEPISRAESVITEPSNIAVNWGVTEPRRTSWLRRFLGLGPPTVRQRVGPTPAISQNTRKWYQKLNPFSRRSGGRNKTRKFRK
jgi:hypothetical protein